MSYLLNNPKPLPVKTEEIEIIEGCLKGQEKYYKILYLKYFDKMLNVCARYTKDREEAKDVLHEGYIKVYKSLEKFERKGSFEGWIRKIMVYTAINHYNKNSVPSLSDYTTDEQQQEYLLNQMVDSQDVIQEMSHRELLEMIQQLPPVYKMVFNLYVIEGYSHKEIAEQLNINEGTSRSNLAKARLNLQKQITEQKKTEAIRYA